MKMEKLPFGKIFTDVSGGNTKVLKSDYLEKENGFYPVIDQGKSTVAGYTSNPGDLFSRSELPVVLFGDHTRTIKHVDFPFAMGADGVKVLKSFSDYDSKYLYHYLTYANVPHFGYDRHFKYLKRIEISVPTGPNSLAEQKRIAAILDKADAIRRKRQQALQLTDDFLRSTFLKMFGDPVTNPMGWDVENFGSIVDNSFRNGLSPSNRGQVNGSVLTLSAVTSGRFESQFTNSVKFDREPSKNQLVDGFVFLICRGNGNLNRVGVGVYAPIDQGTVVFPDTVIGCNPSPEKVTKEYLSFAWSTSAVRRQIERGARTTNGTYKVNQTILSEVKIVKPPLELQLSFSKVFQQIAKQRHRWIQRVEPEEDLFKSLQQRAFSGQL